MLTFVDTIDRLLREQGVSRNKMLTDLGLNKNSMVDWSKRKTIPKATTVLKIADYLNVSASYLCEDISVCLELPHIEIRTEGTTTRVFIDGKELNGIRKISFIQDASESSVVPILQLELVATDMVLNIKKIPELPEVFKEWYVLKNDYDNSSGESL